VKSVVITGASSGIGLETARVLASRGYRVIMVVRNQAKAEAARDAIVTATPGAAVDIVLADLYLQADVRRAGAEIRSRFAPIDVLVNNAGLIHARRELTSDGIEKTFALNHIAAFLLTHELRDHIVEAGRVVTVSSGGHRFAVVRWDDLARQERWTNATLVYGASKLCNLWFTREAARRFGARRITCNALHPGAVATSFGASGSAIFRAGIRIARPFLRTVEQGAETAIYLASAPEVGGTTGAYFIDCKPATPSRAARDDDSARRLWELSEQLTGVMWR
jgi:NAD(P)-dependent dehydrogenase (short-subunit alcohol dehydrogenase family)